jgi:serine protease Do
VILGEVVRPAALTPAQMRRLPAGEYELAKVAGRAPGVPVTAVLDGSPAQQAGLKAGARIRTFDGVPCDGAATFSRLLALREPGDEVTLAVDDVELKVTLGDRDAAQASLVSEESLGMTCVDVGPELRSFLDLAEDVRGVVVRDVRHGSPAQAAGIARGDVLWWGGDGATADLDELRAAIAGAKETIVLRAYRQGETVEFTVRLPGTRTATR